MATKKKSAVVAVAILGILLIIAALLNITGFWKNNQYRFLHNHKHLHLTLGDKELFWFYAVHTNNPNDIMYRILEDAFQSFSPDLVLVEGGANVFEGTRDQALGMGEPDFATYLAKRNNIRVADIEPPFARQIAYLQERYDPEDIFAMYVLRQIGSWELLPEAADRDFDAFALGEIRFLTGNGLLYDGTSPDHVLATMNRHLPQPMDRDNWLNLNVYRTYARGEGIVNEIYLDIVHFRDIHAVELIREKQQTHNRIFIVMGGAHLSAVEEPLREIYAGQSPPK